MINQCCRWVSLARVSTLVVRVLTILLFLELSLVAFSPAHAGTPEEASLASSTVISPRPPADAVAFKGHWYQRVNEAISFVQARMRCQKMGGYLACIETPEENEFVQKLTGGQAVWIGGFHFDEGWKWVNGTPITYTNWGSENPNGKIGEGIVMQFRPNEPGKWFDNPSQKGITNPLGFGGFICEWEKE